MMTMFLLVAGIALTGLICAEDIQQNKDHLLQFPRSIEQNSQNYQALDKTDVGESGNVTKVECVGGFFGYDLKLNFIYNTQTIYSEILKAPEPGCTEKTWAMCESDTIKHYAKNINEDGVAKLDVALPHEANSFGEKLCVILGPTENKPQDVDGHYVALGHKLGCSDNARIDYKKGRKVCCNDQSKFIDCP